MSAATLDPVQCTSNEEFANAAECIRRFPAITRPKLYHAVTVGLVETRLLPGLAPRYSIRDVERLASGARKD
jgi:hypothetical protein